MGEVQTHHMKLLQYETSTTQTPTSTTTSLSLAAASAVQPSSSSLSSSTQDLIANPVHTTVNQPTTVIIRKDIHSFNFSDIELPIERPTAAAHYLHNKHLLRDLTQRSVTGTPKPPTTELDDIFISVKTTKSYHDSRLALIVKTWFQLAKDQVSCLEKLEANKLLQIRGRVNTISSNFSFRIKKGELTCSLFTSNDLYLI